MRRAANRKAARAGRCSAKSRPRNSKRPNYAFIFFMFVLSGVISCGASYALKTPHLLVKKISIDGVKLSDSEEIAAAAHYALKTNILLVRKTPALEKIGRLSEVAEVSMGRTLPDTMWIKVRERTPFAIVTNGLDFFMVQHDGLVFHAVRGPVGKLPLIEVDRSVCFEIGKPSNVPCVSYALEALKSAHRERLKVSKISIDHAGDMCLNMDSNFCVRLGQPDEIDEKMSKVRSALDYHPSIIKEAAYIDVSCPRAAVWKPKSVAEVSL